MANQQKWKKTVSISLSDKDIDKLHALAKRLDRNISDTCRFLINQGWDKN